MKKLCKIATIFILLVSLNSVWAGDVVIYDWEGATTEGWIDFGWGTAAIVTMSASQERAFFGKGALKLDAVIPEADKLDMGENYAPDVKYDFEADIQGWSNFAWGQIQVDLSHSSTQVYAGSYSLAAAGTLAVEGDKWEVGKNANMDLSDFSVIRAQVYIPNPEGLQAKLFGQVGSSWAYAAGGDVMVPVVGWNEIYWDISEMESREFKSLGVQIYCNGGNSVTFDDTVWVDQVECLKYDLTGAKWITMDIFAPDGFHGGGKVFAQTGSGWTWNDCGWFGYAPGWTTLFWNVEDLDLSPASLKRIGAEIYADSAITGIFYIDNFKVCENEPTFKKASKITTLFDFEVNTSGFVSLPWGQQQVTIDTSHSYAVDGVSSLSATGVLPADGEKWEFACGAALDLSLYNYARALVYVSNPDNVELKLFAQDAAWTYTDGTPNKFPVEGWNQVWWNISEVDRGAIHDFGVQVYATGPSDLTTVYVDHIQLSSEILDVPFIPADKPLPLFSFEADKEGFAEFTEFGGGTIDAIDTTSADSRDGMKSLKISTSVQKTHVGKVYPAGSELDLINYAYIEAWVYFPDDFPDWQGGKLIGEFGGDEIASGWHGTDQNQGRWHLLGWDISTLPGRSSISMLGVEIWGASTSGNDILIDHYVAYPAKPAGDEMTGVSIDFDTGTEGWVSLAWGQLPADLAASDVHVWTGDSALAISGTFTGVEGEKLEVASPQTFNFTIGDTIPATMAWAHVFIPDPAGLQVKLFGQFGSGWSYLGGGDILIPKAGWNEIAWKLTDIPLEDLTVVHNFGLQVYSNSSTYDGPVYLDGIRVAVQEIPEAPEPPIGNVPMVNIFDFEESTGNPVSYDWDGIVASEMVLSDEEAWEGTNALKITATYSASAGLNIGWGIGADSSMKAYNYITARVYVPDAAGLGGKLWGKWGADSSWGEGPYVGFVNGWNVLNLNVNNQDVPIAHELGINVWSGSSTYSGPIYIDYITGSRYEAVKYAENLPDSDTEDFEVINDFEIDGETYFWIPGAEGEDIFVSPEMAAYGKRSVQVMVDFEDGVYGAAKFNVIDTSWAGCDYSMADSLAFWVYYPGTGTEGEYLSANLFMQTGADWTWRQESWQPVYPGVWNKVIFIITGSLPPVFFEQVHLAGVQLSNMENEQTISEYKGPIFTDYFMMYAPYIPPEPIPIADAKVDSDEDYIPDSLGATVFIEGIVTTPNFGSHTHYWMQDGTAGICLYSGSMDYDLQIGDKIQVTGEIDQYNGLTQIISDSVKILGSGFDFDTTVVKIADLGEDLEGSIVKIDSVWLLDPSQWPAEGGNGNVDITDGVDTTYIFVDKDTDLDGWSPPLGFNVVAVVDQYTSNIPPNDGYCLRARFQTDFVFVELGIDPDSYLPTEFSLSQNFPNPFNPTTTIKYALAEDIHIRLIVYNILGQEVVTLVNTKQARGYYSLIWDGRNNSRELVGSGIYFYHLVAGDFTSLKKLTLIK